MNNIKKKYLIISVLPILILIYISITPILANKIGKEIVIKGNIYYYEGSDTSSIEYDIENIELEKAPEVFTKYSNDDKNLSRYLNKNIYIVLKENGNYYEVDYATFEKPKENVVYLKGRVNYIQNEVYDKTETTDMKKNQVLRVMYSLNYTISNKQINKEIKDGFRNDKSDSAIPVDIKINVYNGYALFKEAD